MSRESRNFRVINNCQNCLSYYRYFNRGHGCLYDDSDVFLPENCNINICDKWSGKCGGKEVSKKNAPNFRVITGKCCRTCGYYDHDEHNCSKHKFSLMGIILSTADVHVCDDFDSTPRCPNCGEEVHY